MRYLRIFLFQPSIYFRIFVNTDLQKLDKFNFKSLVFVSLKQYWKKIRCTNWTNTVNFSALMECLSLYSNCHFSLSFSIVIFFSRLCYSAAKNGHMMEVFSYVHSKRLTPAPAVLLQVRKKQLSLKGQKYVLSVPKFDTIFIKQRNGLENGFDYDGIQFSSFQLVYKFFRKQQLTVTAAPQGFHGRWTIYSFIDLNQKGEMLSIQSSSELSTKDLCYKPRVSPQVIVENVRKKTKEKRFQGVCFGFDFEAGLEQPKETVPSLVTIYRFCNMPKCWHKSAWSFGTFRTFLIE